MTSKLIPKRRWTSVDLNPFNHLKSVQLNKEKLHAKEKKDDNYLLSGWVRRSLPHLCDELREMIPLKGEQHHPEQAIFKLLSSSKYGRAIYVVVKPEKTVFASQFHLTFYYLGNEVTLPKLIHTEEMLLTLKENRNIDYSAEKVVTEITRIQDQVLETYVKIYQTTRDGRTLIPVLEPCQHALNQLRISLLKTIAVQYSKIYLLSKGDLDIRVTSFLPGIDINAQLTSIHGTGLNGGLFNQSSSGDNVMKTFMQVLVCDACQTWFKSILKYHNDVIMKG